MILLMLAVGLTGIASAQIRFGVKAGYNLATFNTTGFNAEAKLKDKSGFNGGILVSVPLFSSCYLQPEIMYSGQGAVSADNSSNKLTYDYLNVPVLFKYQHESGLFAEIGPQIGFLLGAKITTFGSSEDITSSNESVDFSCVFGIGYKIPKAGLGIDVRYNLGITDVDKNKTDGKVQNSVFQFGVFYMIN